MAWKAIKMPILKDSSLKIQEVSVKIVIISYLESHGFRQIPTFKIR